MLKIKKPQSDQSPQAPAPMPQGNVPLPPMNNPAGGMEPPEGNPPMDEPTDDAIPPVNGPDDSVPGNGIENDADKEEIQSMAGKLAAKLKEYNSRNGHPDADLSKYVAGVINDAAVKNLPDDEVSKIIKKIESEANGEDGEENPETNGQLPANGNQNAGGNQIESSINEIANQLVQDRQGKWKDFPAEVNRTGKSFKTAPFTSPDFE